MPANISTADYDSLRVWEKRIEINRRAGINQKNERAGFTKPALNSIHRYLTGEFIVKPGLIYTMFAPGRDGMREKVGVAVVERLGGGCEIEGWFVRYDYDDFDDTQFQTEELTDILEAMDVAREKRDDLGEVQELEDFT